MPKSAAIISTIIQSIPQPIVILDGAGRVVLVNMAASSIADLKINDLLPGKADDAELAQEFLRLCRSTTTPIPSRLKLHSGYESVAFGHRLSVPDTGIDGAVMIRFDQTMNLTSKFAALNENITSLTDKIRHFGAEKTQLESLVLTDALTNVYNRRGFDQELEKELSRANRYGRGLCLALLDLDHFKSINDAHGHQLGDRILVHFSHRCLEHLRQTDVFCRIGGEEFALLLPETNLATASVVVSRMLDLINAIPLFFNGRRFPYTASAGLAEFRSDDAPESLLQRADRNLYAAKKQGRARLVSTCLDLTDTGSRQSTALRQHPA